MSHSGAPGQGDPGPTQCRADGPIEPGRSAVEAVECDSARFVAMAHAAGGIQPTYLVLTDTEGEPTQLELTDVLSVPEVQNALAYFGDRTDSVRVRTRSERRVAVEEHVNALQDRDDGDVLQFGGCTFDLDVVVG